MWTSLARLENKIFSQFSEMNVKARQYLARLRIYDAVGLCVETTVLNVDQRAVFLSRLFDRVDLIKPAQMSVR